MTAEPHVLLKHILQSIELIEQYTVGVSKEEFLVSFQIQDSVLHRLQIIGEAVANLPDEFIETYPQVIWHKISGMRNVIVHEYFAIDLELTWNTAMKVVPEFKKQIESII